MTNTQYFVYQSLIDIKLKLDRLQGFSEQINAENLRLNLAHTELKSLLPFYYTSSQETSFAQEGRVTSVRTWTPHSLTSGFSRLLRYFKQVAKLFSISPCC